MARVKRIEATAIAVSTKEKRKIKVAAYARVSTDHDEQDGSFETQVAYYESKISSNPNWELVKVYADKGASGTCVEGRKEFKKMLQDANKNKIDLILCKSISRFARNTVTTLETIRELKEKGVAVEFEKENLRTDTNQGELMLTILSALAEQESKSISENIQWGIKAKFKSGKDVHNFYRFLGYEKGWKINGDEAKTISLIYDLYLRNYSMSDICRYLETNNHLRQDKGKRWHPGSISYILNNIAYTGDIILQKTITVDYRGRMRKKNEGEEAMYYVCNHHPAIVSKEKYERVQLELKRRKNKSKRNFNISPFIQTIFTDDVQRTGFRRITLHSNNKKYRSHAYKALNSKYPTLNEKLLYKIMTIVIGRMIAKKESLAIGLKNDLFILNKELRNIKNKRATILISLKDMLNNIAFERDSNKYESKVIDYNKFLKKYESLGDREYDLNIKIDGCKKIINNLDLIKIGEITEDTIKAIYMDLDINIYVNKDYVTVDINSLIKERVDLVKISRSYKIKED